MDGALDFSGQLHAHQQLQQQQLRHGKLFDMTQRPSTAQSSTASASSSLLHAANALRKHAAAASAAAAVAAAASSSASSVQVHIVKSPVPSPLINPSARANPSAGVGLNDDDLLREEGLLGIGSK